MVQAVSIVAVVLPDIEPNEVLLGNVLSIRIDYQFWLTLKHKK